MTSETLFKRFKNCGYVPQGLERDEEVQAIIKWLFVEHKIFVSVTYCTIKFPTKPDPYLKFSGQWRYNCGVEFSENFYCSNPMDNPMDAYFDALRQLLPGFRFSGIWRKKF